MPPDPHTLSYAGVTVPVVTYAIYAEVHAVCPKIKASEHFGCIGGEFHPAQFSICQQWEAPPCYRIWRRTYCSRPRLPEAYTLSCTGSIIPAVAYAVPAEVHTICINVTAAQHFCCTSGRFCSTWFSICQRWRVVIYPSYVTSFGCQALMLILSCLAIRAPSFLRSLQSHSQAAQMLESSSSSSSASGESVFGDEESMLICGTKCLHSVGPQRLVLGQQTPN